jgi:hypothetical protein
MENFEDPFILENFNVNVTLKNGSNVRAYVKVQLLELDEQTELSDLLEVVNYDNDKIINVDDIILFKALSNWNIV